MKLVAPASLAMLAAVSLYVGSHTLEDAPARSAAHSRAPVPLKDAKLNIEHNATDRDTGFQGSSTARAGVASTYVDPPARC